MTNYELGVYISQKCKWSGQDIFEVMQSAFEDSNYHSWNETMTDAWDEFCKAKEYDNA